MNPRLRSILIVIGLLTVVIVAIILIPRGLSLYYQSRGGQHIDYVMRSMEGIQELVCEALPQSNQTAIGEVERGIADLNRAVRLNRNNSQAFYYLGKANCLLGEPNEAKVNYLRYTELRADNPLGYIGLGFANEELGKIDSAVEAWKEGGVGTDDFLNVGRQALDNNKYDEAWKWYGRASQLSPNDGRVFFEIGLLYEELGDWNSALTTYHQSLTDKSSEMRGISSLYYRVGKIYSESISIPDFIIAKESFNAALIRDDFINDWEKADSYYRLGAILRNEGRPPEEFITYFEQAQEIYPLHVFAHILLGVTYYAINPDDFRAEEEIQIALDLDPKNKWGYFHLGEFYRKKGRIEESIVLFEKALEIDPSFERAQRSLQSILIENQID